LEITQLCEKGDLAQLKLLFIRGAKDISGLPLCHAAANGHTHIVRYLIEVHGADINRSAESRFSPLFVAALNGHLALVRCMVQELGADVDKAVSGGGTPLYVS
jgi:ankyrin repeat protein